MATLSESLKRSTSFKQQLAFALALVKHKPPEKQTKDYILEIRGFVKHITESEIFEPDKFFDSVGFWQSAYESSEAEQVKLLNTIFDLEQKNQGLRSAARGQSTNIGNEDVRSTAHKLLDAGVLNPSLHASRKSTKPCQKRLGQQSRVGPILNNAGLDHGEHGSSRMMRRMYSLQRTLQKRHNPSHLAMEAVILCKEAEWELLEAVQRPPKPIHQPGSSSTEIMTKPDLGAIARGMELSFALVYQALNKVAVAKNGDESKGRIVYYLVCLFESTMTALTQHCTAIIMTKHGKSAKLSKDMSYREPQSRDGKPAHPVTSMENEEARCLTNLLSTMALSLNLAKREDQQVMEGYLSLVLDRMGKVLSLLVFEHLQYPSEISAQLSLPAGLVAMRREASPPQCTEIEARHLMLLLTRILNCEASLLSEAALARSKFVELARNRLQKTLLQAVFGCEEPLFQNGLVRPTTPPAQNCASQRLHQLGFSEWFTQELWHLIGWDLLSATSSRTGGSGVA